MSPSASTSGLLVVISGPSGVGKTTIVHAVESELEASFSVSATTRARTEHEIHGKDYFFVTPDEFDAMIEARAFLEYAKVFDRDWYGTPREAVERQLSRGELVLLDIDVQGAIQIREAMDEALLIFILPPSEEELMRRLRARGRDDEEAIQRRFRIAQEEIATAQSCGAYDVMIVNDDLDDAIRRTIETIRTAQERDVDVSESA